MAELKGVNYWHDEPNGQWLAIVENIPDAITRWDRDLKLVYANHAFFEKTGMALSQLLKKNSLEMGQPEEIAMPYMKKLQYVLNTGNRAEHYYYYPTPEGNIYYKSLLIPEYGGDGSIETVLAIAHDITEQKKTEEALTEANERLRVSVRQAIASAESKFKEYTSFIEALTENSADSILAVDKNMIALVFNRQSAREFKKTKDEVLGHVLTDVIPYFKEQPSLWDAMQRGLAGEWVHVGIVPGVDKSGYYEHFYIPLKSSLGEVYAVLHVDHDITLRIENERDLLNLNNQLKEEHKKLEQAHSELSNFTKLASHDLKEPLRKIYTFIELILTHEAHKLSNSGKGNFRRIQTAVHRMSLLTDDIVNFSSITGSNEELTDVDMMDAISEALEPLQTTIAQSEAIILIDELPSIRGYNTLLQHLIRQIVSNGLKFQRNESKPRIHISYDHANGEDLNQPEAHPTSKYHVLTFTDNGIGFEQAYADRIFGMFQRLHSEGHFKGSGMGLAIARRIAEIHNGFITAESTPGEGTTFRCYLKDYSAS